MIRLPRFPTLAVLMATTAMASCSTAAPVDTVGQIAKPPMIATPAQTTPAPPPVLSSCGNDETPYKQAGASTGFHLADEKSLIIPVVYPASL